MVVLYTTHCPRCKVLQTKLDAAGIPYSVVDDEEDMIKKGFMTAPVLEVNGTVMDFPEAFKYVSTIQKGD